jgi:peptide/nickel transport system permease protein
MTQLQPPYRVLPDEPEPPSGAQQFRRRAKAQPGLTFGLVVLTFIIIVAILAPLLAPHDPFAQNLTMRRIPPVWDLWFNDASRSTWAHPLGTDQIGRDYLSRLIHGSRISLLIAIVVTLVSALVGITLGVLGGYYGGRVDAVISFIILTRLSMPIILVALAVVALYGGSTTVVILVLGRLTSSSGTSCQTSPARLSFWPHTRWPSLS